MPAAVITPGQVRTYANLPSEVPEALILEHIGIATRDLISSTGEVAAPEGMAETWAEALTVRALASVFPWLHTFALSGAAKVGRLEGSIEYQFLDPDDIEAALTRLNTRYDELVAQIAPAETNPDDPDQIDVGGLSMIAI